jgi:hypothetical protein
LTAALSTHIVIAQRYRILRELGEGGVGVAFEVFDELEQRRLALKRMLPQEGVRNEQQQVLFRHEYSILAQFAHPNVVQVYDFGVDEGVPFYTMELVVGEHPGTSGPMPWRAVCRLLMTLCEPLGLLHARGWVHRDLSPRNVYVTPDGTPKLLDFGAMASMDDQHRPVGTPPCMAPETHRRQRIDARTDIFGLGALGYYALTAHHAYPARLLAQLPLLWQTSPPKPSERVPGIPDALDQLILSMLSLDMEARPRQLAEVMQRLAASAELSTDRHSQASLTTAGLIAREAELELMRDQLRWSESGRGGTCVVRGARGSGCTRLLDTMGLEAKLLGHAVMRANASRSGTASFALIRELCRTAWATEPERAKAAAQGLEAGLALFDAGTHNEAREVEAQRAFIAWCERWSAQQPLLLLVHECDDIDLESAKLLAQLERRAPGLRLTIALSLRVERPMPRGPLQALMREATLITLAPLDGESIEKLLRALFGDVPNLARVAHWMQRTTGGQPGACMAAARALVHGGLAKFVAGAWQLPEQLENAGSSDLHDLHGGLESLSANASELLRLLALVTQPFPLETSRYRRALQQQSEAAAVTAEGELLATHALVATSEGYALRDMSLLAKVRASMTEAEVTSGHARLAYCYATEGQRIASTYHLWRAFGIAEADRALGSGLSYLGSVDADESVRFAYSTDAIALYEALLLQRKQRNASAAELYPLRMALLTVASASDPSLVRYAPETIAQLRHDAGLDLWGDGDESNDNGARIHRCLEQAHQRHCASDETARGLPPELAVQAIAKCVALLTGVYAVQYDVDGVNQLVPLVVPLRSLSRVLELGADLAEMAAVSITCGNDVRESRVRALEMTRLHMPGLDPMLRERIHRFSTYYLAIEYAVEGRPAALELAESLATAPAFEALALQVRRMHALAHGRFEDAQRYRRERELLSFQCDASDHHLHMSQLRELGMAYDCRDLLELTRHTTAIRERAAKYPGWKPWAELGRAFCHMLADEPQSAYMVADQTQQSLQPFSHGAWQHLVWLKAEAQNDLRQHAQARQGMLELFEQAASRGVAIQRWRIFQTTLDVAEAGIGNREHALEHLDALLIDTAGDLGQDTVVFGRMCEARCQAACIVKDYTGFAKHLDLMEPVYANHPSLRARHARWVRAGKDRFRKLLELLTQADAGALWATRTANDVRLRSPKHQGEYLLSMVLDEIAVDTGQLFRIASDGTLQLLAARPTRPDRKLLLAAERCLTAWSSSGEMQTADDDDERTVDSHLFDTLGRSHVPLWLTRPSHPDELTGLVLVPCTTARLAALSPAFIRAISQHLESLETSSG